MQKLLCTIAALLFCISAAAQSKDYARWVNPFIGTGGHGHTFPGATVPFGMVQLSPDTRIDNWDGSSGYHYSDSQIYGFSHTHLSGTGIPDGCDILITPKLNDSLSSSRMYPLKFSHANEKAEPGYYSVKLEETDIFAELTATTRVGMHRYTLPSTSVSFVVDLNWRDKDLDSDIRVTDNGLEGFRESASWAKKQRVYFALEFSRPLTYKALITSESFAEKREDGSPKKASLRSLITFDTKPGEQILVKVAISYVSIEGARKNLEAELPHWDFDKVRADAKAAWNKELSKIEVSGGTPEQTTNFYTALYHTMIHPNVFNDVDGRYKGHDGKIHQLPGYVASSARSAAMPPYLRRSSASPASDPSSPGGYAAGFGERRHSRKDQIEQQRKSTAFPQIDGQSPMNPHSALRISQSNHYTVFSLWDTFRAAHPLYTIIDQKRTVDFINTFIRIYEQGGRLPVWELWGEETDTMIGYHAVSVIADAMAKGIKGFDYEKAYQAAKHSAELDHFGLAAYKKRGYISMEDENESVSRTLEYAYDDWCIAEMARTLGGGENRSFVSLVDGQVKVDTSSQYRRDYQKYLARSLNFQNLFDRSTGFMRPKKNGGFVEPFAPNEVTFGFTEGNSWQYSFFVPHDVGSLIELHGGRDKLAAKLDELFTTDQNLAGREQADLTGLIGQYAHGNEPSHHVAYLYNYVEQPWKTQKMVRRIMDEFYTNAPDGLIGNEDCGQMSAWYIMSAMGFYSVAPGSPEYDLGSPLFKEVRINLENGKTFRISAPNVSSTNVYVRSTKLNGIRDGLTRTKLPHKEILNGGTLEFEMSSKPAPFTKLFGGLINYKDPLVRNLTAVPAINGERTFTGSTTVSLSTPTKGAKIYYSINGEDPKSEHGVLYSTPFAINRTTTVRAIADLEKVAIRTRNWSYETRGTFTLRPHDWTVKVTSGYSTQYTGGGDNAIVDGIRGTTNFASGEWQGIQGKPYEAIIDLKRETEIRELGASFLQVAGPWIWMPDSVEFDVSKDGVNFTRVAEIRPNFPQREMTPTIREFTRATAPTEARYVRVKAHNFGKIPSWHPGAGGDPWIFVDEVIIR